MEEPEMQLKVKKVTDKFTESLYVLANEPSVALFRLQEHVRRSRAFHVTDKFTESLYVLANEPSVALFRLQEHVRRSLPELAQHKSDMQSWEEQSQGAIYTVEYACSAIKNMTDSSVYFKSIDNLLKHSIAMKEQLNSTQGRSTINPQPKNPPGTS